MKSNKSFLLIPLVFLFQVLFSPVDLALTDLKDGLHQNDSGILYTAPLSNIVSGSSIKVFKKNPFKGFFKDSMVDFALVKVPAQSVPHFLAILFTQYSQRQNLARAPPVV